VVEYFPEAIAAEFKTQEQLVEGTLKSLCGVFDENINALKYTLTKNQADFVPTYKFSPTMKSKTIVLVKKMVGAKQNESNNGDLRFALIEPCLSVNRPSKITFVVKRCVNWIGIGICLKQVVSGKNYKFSCNVSSQLRQFNWPRQLPNIVERLHLVAQSRRGQHEEQVFQLHHKRPDHSGV